MITFAITGMGRSGTMWLSGIMNQSRKFQVEHEPQGVNSARFAYGRFYQARQEGHNYGEVNSRLRWCMRDLPLDLAYVIIRHPIELARSSYNRGWGVEWIRDDLEPSLVKLDDYVTLKWTGSGGDTPESDVIAEAVSFQEMVSEPKYTRKMLHRFGIHDVVVKEEDCATPVNTNKRYDELPRDMCEEVQKRCGWFMNKYQAMWDG